MPARVKGVEVAIPKVLPVVMAPVKVDAPVTVKVLEADNGPATLKLAVTDEEALETNPPVRVERPVTPKVLLRVEAPVTESVPVAVIFETFARLPEM